MGPYSILTCTPQLFLSHPSALSAPSFGTEVIHKVKDRLRCFEPGLCQGCEVLECPGHGAHPFWCCYYKTEGLQGWWNGHGGCAGAGNTSKAPQREEVLSLNRLMCPHGDWEGGTASGLGPLGMPRTGQAGVGMAETTYSCEAMRKRIWTSFRSWKQGRW